MKNMTQHISTIALAVTLTVSMALPALAVQFTDVSGNWAQQAIGDLSQRGIITGYPLGQFRPYGQVTRAEFASILVKAMNLNSESNYHSTHFADVPSSFWGYNAIQTVSANGLVTGYPGGLFRPSQNISMAEALSVLVKASRIPIPNNAKTTDILTNFSDHGQVPDWAKPSVAAAIRSGIFANFPNPNMIEPNKPANRADIGQSCGYCGAHSEFCHCGGQSGFKPGWGLWTNRWVYERFGDSAGEYDSGPRLSYSGSDCVYSIDNTTIQLRS
jgi:hypothetical protein